MAYSWKLYNAARIVMQDMVRLKEGEAILIYADTASDGEVLDALAKAAYCAGGVVCVLVYAERPSVDMEPPKPLAAAMKASDVIIELAEKYIIHTQAYYEALAAGARTLSLTGVTRGIMERCIGGIDYSRMVEFGEALAEILRSASRMEVQTPAGTNLVFEFHGRPVFHNSGVVIKPGDQSFLGGQISWAPIEETIEGVIVIDGSIWPPDELGLLKNPVKLMVEGGVIKCVEGGSEARIFEKWLESFGDPNMFKIAHVSYGFNPGARLTGKILEDERVFGCLEIGVGAQSPRFCGKVGRAAAHADGVMLNPTVTLDSTLLEKDGVFLHPRLVNLQTRLVNLQNR